jgi:polysaccharide biosynthesis transport protein
MAGGVSVRGGWHVKDAQGHEAGQYALPTMADTGEVDLRRFFRTVYRGKWILILTTVVTMGATIYWTRQATPLYSADVLIVIEPRSSTIVRAEEAVQDVNSDAAKVNTEVAALQSRGLAARVIRDLGLHSDPEFAPKAPADGARATGGKDEEASRDGLLAYANPAALLSALESLKSFLASAWAGDVGDAQSAAAVEDEEQSHALLGATEEGGAAALLPRFLRRLSVESEDKSRLIRIGFTSTEPRKAALIANTIAEEYVESQLETKSEAARRAAERLEVRLAELGETVKSLEQSVQQRRAETGSNTIGIVSQRLAELTSKLVTAQTASAAAGARYEKVRTVLESRGNLHALPPIIGSSVGQALRAQPTELIQRLSDLQTIFGENHPQIISVRAEIAGIEERWHREINNVLTALRDEVESAQMNEAALRHQLEDVRQEMFQLDQAEASIAQVAQRLKANQDLYQNLLKQYTEAVALRETQQSDARIISPAQVPLSPSHPNFPRIIALSFVGSTSLAVFLLVIAERLRQKLGTVEDVERQVRLQAIGVIPELPRLRRLASTPRNYIQREPPSEFGGAFRRLRSLLTLSDGRVYRARCSSPPVLPVRARQPSPCASASPAYRRVIRLSHCDLARPEVHRT